MQTTVGSKRFDLGQYKVAALAVGIAVSVVVGAVAYSQTRDEAPAASTTRRALTTSAEQMQFIEQNTQLPEAALSMDDTPPYMDLKGWPQAAPQVVPNDGLNAYYVEGAGEGLLGPAIPEVVPAVKAYWQPNMGEGRLNVVSPSDDARTGVPTQEDYRLRDQNVLPGDDAHLLPFGEFGEPY